MMRIASDRWAEVREAMKVPAAPKSELHLVLARAITELPRFAYRFHTELELHDGIAAVLDSLGLPYLREFVASPRDRFDFLVEPGLVIEAKVHGSLAPAVTQCGRYAALDEVGAVLLATSRFWGRLPDLKPDLTLHGKPVRMIQLKGQSF